MGPYSWRRALLDWLAFLPVRFAFRVIWCAAQINRDARDVYRAMWGANLDLPPLPARKETN